MLEQLSLFDLPTTGRSTFTESQNFETKPLITQTDIRNTLLRGSNFCGGKQRIYEHYQAKHSIKASIDFLKDEFGIGGSTLTLESSERAHNWHDGKGIGINLFNGDARIELSWSQVNVLYKELKNRGILKA